MKQEFRWFLILLVFAGLVCLISVSSVYGACVFFDSQNSVEQGCVNSLQVKDRIWVLLSAFVFGVVAAEVVYLAFE